MRYKKFIVLRCLEIYQNSTDPFYRVCKFYTAWYHAYLGLCHLQKVSIDKKKIATRNKIIFNLSIKKINLTTLYSFIKKDEKVISEFLELTKSSPVMVLEMDMNKEPVPFCFADEVRL